MKFRRFVIAPLLLAAAVSCDDTVDSITDQLNLDRPIDIAFACYGGLRLTGGAAADPTQTIIETAMPIQACDIRSGTHDASTLAPVPPGQETITVTSGSGATTTSNPGNSFYYGFILQSEPGTVALAQWDTKPSSSFAGGDVLVLDADPLIPGKNGISVGEDPAAIVSDSVGCYEVTANAGSCDMSSIDINTAIEVATDNADAVAKGEKVIVNRIEITNASGQPIRAKPRAMVAQPPGGTIGNACAATPTGLVYVAYPSCHLVAGIDLSTGQVVSGIQFDAAGTPTIVDGNVTCADECSGGGAVTAGARPIALALEVDPTTDRRLLAIGSENSSLVTLVELDLSNNPVSRSTVALQQNRTNDLGVTAVAISPTIGMGGDGGFINDDSALGGQSQFVYAIATDNTVRVADIDGGLNKECDTQIDPRFLHDVSDVHFLSCPHVGDPLPPRRAGARGPGIQLVGDADPTSIDIFKVDAVVGDTRDMGAPTRMIGYFGVIAGSNGATYVLNVDNDDWFDTVDPNEPVGTAIPLDIANQLRDSVPNRQDIAVQAASDTDPTLVPICGTNGVDATGAATTTGTSLSTAAFESTRFDGTFTRTLPVLPTATVATEKIGILPSIRQVLCVGQDQPLGVPVSELSFAAPNDVRDQEFPDLFGLPYYDENWTLTYEGSVSIDTDVTAANGPAVRTSQMYIDADGIRLHDQTKPFCDAGVEPYDIVQLRGCDSTLGDSDCPIGYTCFVHPESLVPNLGSCMATDEADRLANACKEFLTSLRQYTVGTTTSGELKLLPRKHVLVTSPVDGCTDDDQCHALANYALRNENGTNPIDDNTADDTHTYSCAVDTARKPELAADGVSPLKRCIETCQIDTDCDAGNVCDNGTCMEGVIPPQSCVNAPQRYELRVGEAFAVVGEQSGYHHHVIADAGGNCIQDPNGSIYDIGRIPLRAPACDPTANPYTGQHTDGTFDPNPCEAVVAQTESDNNYVHNTCAPGNPVTSIVTRQADAIRYRGRGLTLTIVDPTYAGDQVCIGDGLGAAGLAPGTKIPVVPPLYQEAVRIVSGFFPLVIQTGAAYPVKVRRGPGESIWVMDEGDYLSQSVDIASTRGKVFRIESAAIGIVNVLQ
jgi:hypothetical protein